MLLLCGIVFSLAGCQPEPEPVNGADGIGDPYYAQLGNGGYDVQHYSLALEVDPATNAITATETIEAKALERLSSLNLDFEGLTVDTVTVNDAAATFVRQDQELTITPTKPLSANRSFSIGITYHGNPKPVTPITSAEVLGKVGWFHNADDSINVMNEPNGAASWYPVNNHPLDKATYHFDIRVPKPWVVAAPGVLRETKEEGDYLHYLWDMNQPMASYVTSINIDHYTVETASGPNNLPLRSYFPPGFPDRLKKPYSRIPEMIEYFSSFFGPYPFDAYGVVIAGNALCDMTNGWAEEVQTLSLYCPDTFNETLVAHELAHQWFGNSVSLERWQDLWLKEGMARYAEWMWFTRDQDLDAMNNRFVLPNLSRAYAAPPGQPRVDKLFTHDAYQGGALIFHALRLKVKDEAFFKILRTYLERYRYGNAGSEEFIAVAEEISGQELKGLFETWLTEAKPPELSKLSEF